MPVGSIKNIVLTHDYKALITIHVDSSLTPLHEGTTAQVRVPSLTSVANRYIALTPGPNNQRPPTRAARRGDAADDRHARRRGSRPAVQRVQPTDAQGAAAGAPGLGRTVRRRRATTSACRSNTSARRWPPATTSSPSSSGTRRRSRASSWNRPRRSPRSARAPHSSRSLVENANTTFQAVGATAGEPRPGPAPAAHHPAPGQPHVCGTAVDVRGADKARERVQARHEATSRCSSRGCTPLLSTATPVVQQLQRGNRPARAEQRPHRCIPRSAGARAGALDQLAERRHRAEGIGADHRLLRSLQPRPAGLRPRLRRGQRLLRRQRPLRARGPRVRQLLARREQHPDARSPRNRGWKA